MDVWQRVRGRRFMLPAAARMSPLWAAVSILAHSAVTVAVGFALVRSGVPASPSDDPPKAKTAVNPSSAAATTSSEQLASRRPRDVSDRSGFTLLA